MALLGHSTPYHFFALRVFVTLWVQGLEEFPEAPTYQLQH